MTDRRLDDAIDRAVREIMNVDGSADVKAQVLRRLEHRGPQIFTWPRFAAAAAAVALLLAFALLRAPQPDPVTKTATGPTPVAEPVPKLTTPEIQRASEKPSAHSPHGQRHRLQRRVAAAVAPELPSTIPALHTIDPLVVEPPRPRDIERRAIAIAPLAAIPDVRVEPLSPPGRRD